MDSGFGTFIMVLCFGIVAAQLGTAMGQIERDAVKNVRKVKTITHERYFRLQPADVSSKNYTFTLPNR